MKSHSMRMPGAPLRAASYQCEILRARPKKGMLTGSRYCRALVSAHRIVCPDDQREVPRCLLLPDVRGSRTNGRTDFSLASASIAE